MTPQTFAARDARSGAPLFDPFGTNASAIFVTSLMDFFIFNVENACQCVRRMSNVRSASQFEDALTDTMRDQFEALADQVEELSALMAPEYDDSKHCFWD